MEASTFEMIQKSYHPTVQEVQSVYPLVLQYDDATLCTSLFSQLFYMAPAAIKDDKLIVLTLTHEHDELLSRVAADPFRTPFWTHGDLPPNSNLPINRSIFRAQNRTTAT